MNGERVLFIGDGLALTTGFATVIRYVAREFVRQGHEVHQLAALDSPPDCRSEPYTLSGVTPWFPSSDVIGVSVARDVCMKIKPTLIVIICDPGQAYQWIVRLKQLYDWTNAQRPRVALYSPIEGSPITGSFAAAFREADSAITCTEWGAKQLLKQWSINVPFVHHGVDTSYFAPLSYIERNNVRHRLGWTDKFVVSYVARNNGRKGHDRMIKAASVIDTTAARSNVMFYLHCKPFEEYILDGWDLNEMRAHYGVEGRVQFPADLADAQRGIATAELSLRLAASDLYISASSVEGFGLPTLEAMACGVPVIVPQDGGNQEEVAGDAALATMTARDWGTWHTGAELIHVDPNTIAQAALEFSKPQHKATLREFGDKSLARATLNTFNWQYNTELIASYVLDALVV